MDEMVEELNYNCNYNMFLIRILLPDLKSPEERSLVMKWINKLTHYSHDIAAMRLRNEFMYNLVLHMQKGKLSAPFCSEPPADIASVSQNMTAEDRGGDAHHKEEEPMIYQNSPDGGVFLAAQPVPRSGAFCYLAVISKEN